MAGPLTQLDSRLSPHVRALAERQTPIPTIAAEAQAMAAHDVRLVRGDIGQIVGLDPDKEVLYGPPVGLEPLRTTIAATYRAVFAPGSALAEVPLDAANVAVTTGAAEALVLLFHCFARDRVVALPRGHWENYQNGVELAGGRTVVVDYFDGDGRLDLLGLEQQLQTAGARVVVVNFPCNPTGAVLSTDEFQAVADLVRRLDLVAIGDDVYARLRYDGAPPEILVQYAPDHAVSVSSASKEYLLPGARVGYVVTAHAALTDRVLRKLTRAQSASPNVLGQRRLLDLMRTDLADVEAGRPPGILAPIRDACAERRDALLGVLDRHGFATWGGARRPPMGTIFLMAYLPSWWTGTDVEFSAAAITAGCLSSIPGSAFGLPGTVRLSFGAMTLADIERLDTNLAVWRQRLALG